VEPRSSLSIDEFWNAAHRDTEVKWLSGYPGPEIWERLEVTDRIVPGAIVLNIGVGTGRCTRDLHAQGCIVHALDISPEATAKVEDITAATYLASALDRLPANTFDVALSHLVAQHNLDEPLLAQMRAVIRSLKPSGIFAMQFSKPVGNQILIAPNTESAMGGSVWRTPEKVHRMIEASGGRAARSVPKEFSDEKAWAWHVVHVAKAEAEY
jgi:SAM-dependent methyltransferase